MVLDSGDLGRSTSTVCLADGGSKDLIIRGGHNIDPIVNRGGAGSPSAVETAQRSGLPDTYAGELPMAFVS